MVWNVKKSNPFVAIGIYAAVLHALNDMDQDLLLVAKDDELGRNCRFLSRGAQEYMRPAFSLALE